MARSTIKELVVKILGEDTQLQQASGRSTAAIKRIGASAVQMGKTLAVAGVAGATALAALVKRQINAADNAIKTATAIGTTVETLTAMRHAASLGGVANEELEKGLAKLARSASDAAAGLMTQKSAFDALEITVTNADGTLRSQRELLGDLADRFARMEDGTRKTALAQELLGRSGTKLIPMLNAGRDGLKEMTDEAARLGLVIDTDTARAAEAFNDNLTRLKGSFTGVVNLVAQRVLPILVDLSDRFVDASGKTDELRASVSKSEAVLRTFLTTGAILKGVLTAVGETLGSVAAAVSLAVEGRFRDAFRAADAIQHESEATLRKTAEEISVIWDELGKDIEGRAPAIGRQLAAPAVEARTVIQTEAMKAQQAIEKLVGALAEERVTLGMSADELLRFKLEMLGASEETIAHAIAIQQDTAALRANAEANAEVAKRGEAITAQYLTAQEIFAARQAELNELLARGGIDATTFGRAIADARAELVQAGEESEDFGATFGDVIESAATQGKLSFKSFADSVLAQLQRIIVKALVARAVAFFLPGAGSIGQLAVGAVARRQHGGPVERGHPYLVGERGPELFVPQASGQVVPGGAGGISAADILAQLPPIPTAGPPELAATHWWYRRLLSAAVPDALDRGVRFA